jgi:DNA repair photolyase
VNPALLDYDPAGRTRVRLSLMPAETATKVDLRTSRMAERIAFIDPLVAAGYEVHVNLSPVIVHDGWLERWQELFEQLDDGIGPAAKAQLKAEVIFLTHNEALHEVNLGWHPTGESLLWRPDIQETKRSQTGGTNVRYRSGLKGRMVRDFVALLSERLPWCEVRYAF